MGILYSKSIGVLAAKGKYIFPLDNDDMFLDKDVFETVTNIAESGSFDIVEFKGIESFVGSSDISKNTIKNIHFTRRKKVLNLVMIQPELGKFPVQPYPNLIGYNVYDAYIWENALKQKCIKKQ